jgi:hypothetical protein
VARDPQGLEKQYEVFIQESVDAKAVIDLAGTFRENIINHFTTHIISELKTDGADWR